ncbi:MAG: hypothetical protein HN742_38180 [Lentisphaerae bacterium]|jgi:hypothetical protein|nr:hypothetical protein [Lentisphaerota bacterium]MBT4819139.1 hypothetical protein [Lentisphaerota bacterium]MBT5608419.1 hypothetical protein [Lentisphaerota bacterium]MBT7055037.1 hypothetical protein [Lentisphaerota bacterium]MBT7847757.1 hypothetical protein [Lentisphaerota bacterium]
MMMLPANATDERMLDLVRDWVDALVKEDYEAAFAMTAHDPYYKWTPVLMQSVIHGYGLPEPRGDGKVFRVTPMDSASGQRPRHEVEYFDEPRPVTDTDQSVVGEVWFDLPLNGEWSDLTATFQVRRSTNYTVLVLNEIHVF